MHQLESSTHGSRRPIHFPQSIPPSSRTAFAKSFRSTSCPLMLMTRWLLALDVDVTIFAFHDALFAAVRVAMQLEAHVGVRVGADIGAARVHVVTRREALPHRCSQRACSRMNIPYALANMLLPWRRRASRTGVFHWRKADRIANTYTTPRPPLLPSLKQLIV